MAEAHDRSHLKRLPAGRRGVETYSKLVALPASKRHRLLIGGSDPELDYVGKLRLVGHLGEDAVAIGVAVGEDLLEVGEPRVARLPGETTTNSMSVLPLPTIAGSQVARS